MACEKNHGYDMKVDAVMAVLVFEDVSSSSLVNSLSYYFYSRIFLHSSLDCGKSQRWQGWCHDSSLKYLNGLSRSYREEIENKTR